MKRGIIFCSGEMSDKDICDISIINSSLIICSDGGFHHANKLGITPDVVIGDFDSSDIKLSKNTKQIIYPPEKDHTDTNIAIDYAIEQGCNEILIYGGFGKRLDHEFSHFSLLLYGLNKGIKIKLINQHNEIFMENRSFSLKRNNKKYVSFFPFGGDVMNFSVSGLKYEAKDITLDCGLVQATSNEFTDCDIATVSFSSGNVLVILCNDLL